MIHKVCKDIISNLQINRFIETGTLVGETVVRVSNWFQELDKDFGTIVRSEVNEYLSLFSHKRKILYPIFKHSNAWARTKVYSVDIDMEKQKILEELFSSNPNIKIICKPSENFIKEAIDNCLVTDNDNSFFYLDAHWGDYWPLRDEIRQILRLKKSIIVIDDFVVPFRPLHLFCVYNNKVCGWYYIRGFFKKFNIQVYFPKKSNMDYRGTVIIFVGYNQDELEFMKKLPCFKPLFKGDIFLTVLGKLMFFFFGSLLNCLGSYLMHNIQRKIE